MSDEQVVAILRDYSPAGLKPLEVAVMSFVEKVSLRAHSVTPQDIEGLRGHGLTDAEILDIVLTTSARNFFSKVLDAVGAEPDAAYLGLDPELREAWQKVAHLKRGARPLFARPARPGICLKRGATFLCRPPCLGVIGGYPYSLNPRTMNTYLKGARG